MSPAQVRPSEPPLLNHNTHGISGHHCKQLGQGGRCMIGIAMVMRSYFDCSTCRVVNWFTVPFTPSLLPSGPVESTV